MTATGRGTITDVKQTDTQRLQPGNLRSFVNSDLFIKTVLEACLKLRCAEMENKRKAGLVEGCLTIIS